MAFAAISVLFVMDGLLSSTGFNQYNIPGAKALNGDNSAVRVAVALNSGGNRPSPWDGPTQADGGFPAILAFNEIGDYIGASDWEHRPKIESGGFEDVVVHQEALGPSQQPTYLQFFAGNDAICVAYISQVWPDGQSRGWLGDIGHACGRDWYYSHITVGNDHHSPDCMWMDADHSNDPEHRVVAAMQIHMEDYTNLTTHTYSSDPAHYCRQESIIFHRETDSGINLHHDAPPEASLFKPSGAPPEGTCCMDEDKPTITRLNKKRLPQPQQQRRRIRTPSLAKRLISSPRDEHSASALCSSPTSHGPDFVSHSEGMFCDMETKTVWPLCKEGDVVEECFRWEMRALVTAMEGLVRAYERVEEWGEGEGGIGEGWK